MEQDLVLDGYTANENYAPDFDFAINDFGIEFLTDSCSIVSCYEDKKIDHRLNRAMASVACKGSHFIKGNEFKFEKTSDEVDLESNIFTISNITGGINISSYGSSVFIDKSEHGKDFYQSGLRLEKHQDSAYLGMVYMVSDRDSKEHGFIGGETHFYPFKKGKTPNKINKISSGVIVHNCRDENLDYDKARMIVLKPNQLLIFDQQAGCHAVSHIQPRTDWTGKYHAERSIILFQIHFKPGVELKFELTKKAISIDKNNEKRKSMILEFGIFLSDTAALETKFKVKSSSVGYLYIRINSLPCTLRDIQINLEWWKCARDTENVEAICKNEASRVLSLVEECHLFQGEWWRDGRDSNPRPPA